MNTTKPPPLSECVRRSLESYFADLGGAKTHALHALVISEVEKPLLEKVMEHAAGNQLRAAEILGINRNTLRKRIHELGIWSGR